MEVRLGPSGPGDGFGGYRAQLVETLRDKGIRNLAVLRAIAQVPRHRFVPDYLQHRAYDDVALPIGDGQTISQPWVQARSLEALELTGHDRVLEIGTGSGYQTALLAHLTDEVVSVERVRSLSERARLALESIGVRSVALLVSDGTLGWLPRAPYHAIVVSAASPEIPAPLIAQLSVGGRLVLPVGNRDVQALTLVVKSGQGIESRPLADARFVPLIGEHGFDASTPT